MVLLLFVGEVVGGMLSRSIFFFLSTSILILNLLVPVVVVLSLACAVVIMSNRLGWSAFLTIFLEPFPLSGFARLLEPFLTKLY